MTTASRERGWSKSASTRHRFAAGTFTVALSKEYSMTTGDDAEDADDGDPIDRSETAVTAATDADGDDDDDPAAGTVTESHEDARDDGGDDEDGLDEPAIDLDVGRLAITTCFVGVVIGSLLPWVSLPELTLYGFQVYGSITIAIALVAGVLTHVLGWDRRAMALLFVAGVLIASLALVYLPFGGVGVIVTALSGGALAFLAAGRFSKLGAQSPDSDSPESGSPDSD